MSVMSSSPSFLAVWPSQVRPGIGDDHVRVHLFDPRLVGRHHAVMAVGEVECAAVVDDDERLRQPAL